MCVVWCSAGGHHSAHWPRKDDPVLEHLLRDFRSSALRKHFFANDPKEYTDTLDVKLLVRSYINWPLVTLLYQFCLAAPLSTGAGTAAADMHQAPLTLPPVCAFNRAMLHLRFWLSAAIVGRHMLVLHPASCYRQHCCYVVAVVCRLAHTTWLARSLLQGSSCMTGCISGSTAGLRTPARQQGSQQQLLRALTL